MYNPWQGLGIVESANIFVCIYANIIAPSVGTSVTKEHITRADTTASLSKHVVVAWLFFHFFLLSFSLFFFSSCDTLLHGEHMYAKTIFWMYNERCARGSGAHWQEIQRGCGLSIPQKFHFHILHSRNTQSSTTTVFRQRSDTRIAFACV